MGERVLLKVKVERPRRDFEVSGQLAWARHKGGAGNLREAYGVDFLSDAERLLQFARSQLDSSAVRLGARLATDLPTDLLDSMTTGMALNCGLALISAQVW